MRRALAPRVELAPAAAAAHPVFEVRRLQALHHAGERVPRVLARANGIHHRSRRWVTLFARSALLWRVAPKEARRIHAPDAALARISRR